MPITPEDRARQNIDKLLIEAGWIVQDKRATNLSAGRGVAVGEFPLTSGHGEADYLLFIDGAPVGVVEAEKEGERLIRDLDVLIDEQMAEIHEEHGASALSSVEDAVNDQELVELYAARNAAQELLDGMDPVEER